MKLINIYFPTIILISVVLSISCTSVSVVQSDSQNDIQVQITETEDESSNYIEPIIVDGVIDFTDLEYRFLWDTSPDNGTMLFFASIPPKMYRDKEILDAVAEAARQASMLYSSKVDAKFAVKSNGWDMGSIESLDIQYNSNMAKAIESKIKVINHYRDREGTYILAELDGINYRSEYSVSFGGEDNPDWIINLPEIPGYYVAIGTEEQSNLMIDSIRKADEQALVGLAKQFSVVVKSKTNVNQSEGSGTRVNELQYQITSAQISGFYILSRWSMPNPNGRTYFSLAVCPVNQ